MPTVQQGVGLPQDREDPAQRLWRGGLEPINSPAASSTAMVWWSRGLLVIGASSSEALAGQYRGVLEHLLSSVLLWRGTVQGLQVNLQPAVRLWHGKLEAFL
jgi:hypothetical protein